MFVSELELGSGSEFICCPIYFNFMGWITLRLQPPQATDFKNKSKTVEDDAAKGGFGSGQFSKERRGTELQLAVRTSPERQKVQHAGFGVGCIS